MKARAKKEPGMTLLVVLVVLAMAGTVLAISARRSCERAILAATARRDLQVKWGFLSCRAVYLPAAEQLLDEARKPDRPPPICVRRSIVLGGLSFRLLLADQQAKANANLLAARRHDSGLAASLRVLLADQRRPIKIELRPGAPPAGLISKVPRRYVSFDQLFVAAGPAALVSFQTHGKAAFDRVSPWGSGKVNVRRADRTVMREVLKGVLDEEELDKLCRLREQVPDFSLQQFFAELELTGEGDENDGSEKYEAGQQEKQKRERKEKKEQRLKALRDALTVTSRCHSLWVSAREGLGRGQPRRRWHRLYVVQEGDAENDAGEWTLTW